MQLEAHVVAVIQHSDRGMEERLISSVATVAMFHPCAMEQAPGSWARSRGLSAYMQLGLGYTSVMSV